LLLIVALAALAETTLRLIAFRYVSFSVYDRRMGFSLKPGAEGVWDHEGYARVKINSAGFRDLERTSKKPEDTVRLAVLGDSYAEAMQVALEKSFWARLEGRLNVCRAFGRKKAEVLNFGVSGYGTGQELLVLKNRVLAYSPDIVLLAFTTGNDIRDNYKPLPRYIPLRPFFLLKNGKIEEDDSFVNDPGFKAQNSLRKRAYRALAQYIRLLQLANFLKDRAFGVVNRFFPGDAVGVSYEPGLDEAVYGEPPDAVWAGAWEVAEALIREIRDEAEKHGAKFILVSMSNAVQIAVGTDARERAPGKKSPDFFYPEKRLERAATRDGIDYLPLAPAMRGYADKNKVFLHGFANSKLGYGHWNEDGHGVAADLIAERFCGKKN
jgi:hypothetical protein